VARPAAEPALPSRLPALSIPAPVRRLPPVCPQTSSGQVTQPYRASRTPGTPRSCRRTISFSAKPHPEAPSLMKQRCRSSTETHHSLNWTSHEVLVTCVLICVHFVNCRARSRPRVPQSTERAARRRCGSTGPHPRHAQRQAGGGAGADRRVPGA
jgi:hypothetical protein